MSQALVEERFLAKMALSLKDSIRAILTAIVITMKEILAQMLGSSAKYSCDESMRGKTVLITGGATGMGKEAALEFAKNGARVILACLYMDEARCTQDHITSVTGNREIVAKYLDVSSMESIRDFAQDIRKTEPRIDILINNAGVVGVLGYTESGLAKVMATNYIGPFLLTHLLLDLLMKAPNGRIINVSSSMHLVPQKLDLQALYTDSAMAYPNSKLFLLMFTLHLSHKLRHIDVTANAIHPGVVGTGIFDSLPLWLYCLCLPLKYLFSKSGKHGAVNYVYLGASSNMLRVSGKYFVDCKESSVNPLALDLNERKRLWEETEKIVKLSKEERIEKIFHDKKKTP